MNKRQIDRLISYCRMSQMDLKARLEIELSEEREVVNQDGFLYSFGTHPVLLVAHLDTVHEDERGLPSKINTDENGYLSCPEGIGGDDRCGVFIIMEIIKQLDCHVLFCEDEEKHGIGATKFTEADITPNVYFIVEFDRKGKDDCVFYGCNNPDFIKFVEQYGLNFNTGSFSDISIIAPHLEIAAVNLSSGYYNAHRSDEIVCPDDITSIIERSILLIRDVSIPYKYF